MIKPSKEITERKETDLIQLRGDYEACREIATLTEHNGWQRIKTIIEANLKAVELRLDDFQSITDKGRDFLLKERIDFKWFLDLVEGAEDRMSALAAEIAQAEAKASERKRDTPAG